MKTSEVVRLINLLGANGFGAASIQWGEQNAYADLRVYSVEPKQDNATSNEGTKGN